MKKLLFLLSALSVSLNAAPVQWTVASGGNGHWYELVTTPSIFVGQDFNAALADATSRTHLGQPGYLATVTSAAENAFLRDTFAVPLGFGGGGAAFLGASDAAQNGVFRWLGGPEAGQALTFTNFAAGNPVLSGNATNYLTFLEGNGLDGQWAGSNIGSFGYFVEYNGAPPSNAVPEPSTLLPAGAALAAIARYRAAKR